MPVHRVVSRPALVAVALVLSACGGSADADGPAPPRRFGTGDLPGLVLRADEAPAGTEFVPSASGALKLEELWDPDCCPGQVAAFEDAGFVGAYAAFFEKPGHSGDPIDTRPGVEIASSTAALFATAAGASRALRDWYAYYDSPVLDPLGVEGLGDEAIAVVGHPNAPAEVLYLYLWRIDRLVLSLRVSAGQGSVDPRQVRAMVDAMDRRAS